MRSGPDCSEPLVSNRFDFLEIGYRIRMAPEVKLQTLHILQLPQFPNEFLRILRCFRTGQLQ